MRHLSSPRGGHGAFAVREVPNGFAAGKPEVPRTLEFRHLYRSGAGGGNRTLTSHVAHGILSPRRLPFRHPGLVLTIAAGLLTVNEVGQGSVLGGTGDTAGGPWGCACRAVHWRRQPESNRRIAVLQTAALATWLCRLRSIVPQTKRGPDMARPASGRFWSGRRDSNPRPSPWQGGALPTELLPLMHSRREPARRAHRSLERATGLEPATPSLGSWCSAN